VGDRILSIEGKPIERFSELQAAVSTAPGQTLAMRVLRGNSEISATATVEARGTTGILGVRSAAPPPVFEPVGLGASLVGGVVRTWDVSAQTLAGLWQMITAQRGTEELGGPLRIAQLRFCRCWLCRCLFCRRCFCRRRFLRLFFHRGCVLARGLRGGRRRRGGRGGTDRGGRWGEHGCRRRRAKKELLRMCRHAIVAAIHAVEDGGLPARGPRATLRRRFCGGHSRQLLKRRWCGCRGF
jgi:hypothetical protein